MKAQRGSRCTAPLLLEPRRYMGVVVNDTPGQLYPRQRDPMHIIQNGWVGPTASLDGCRKSHPTGIRSSDRPAHSESLYRLSNPGPLPQQHDRDNVPRSIAYLRQLAGGWWCGQWLWLVQNGDDAVGGRGDWGMTIQCSRIAAGCAPASAAPSVPPASRLHTNRVTLTLLTFQRPAPLEIHFTYLCNKQLYCTFNTCRIICLIFNNAAYFSFIFFSNNTFLSFLWGTISHSQHFSLFLLMRDQFRLYKAIIRLFINKNGQLCMGWRGRPSPFTI
jgi:hypothetical protein